VNGRKIEALWFLCHRAGPHGRTSSPGCVLRPAILPEHKQGDEGELADERAERHINRRLCAQNRFDDAV
jgi:hypothetical protein